MPPGNQNVNINFNANTSGLVSGANKVISAFKQVSNSAKSTVGQLNNLSNALGKVSKFSASGPIRGMGLFGQAISKTNGFFANHNKSLALSATYYKGLVGQVSNLNRFINVLGSSVRQIGQGLQNFATVFSIYVSLPVSAFIGGMTKGLIDFQDKLVEVRRTTGLSMSDVSKLGEQIQAISLTSPTSVEDLAVQAAAWGRLGVVGVDTIAKLVESSDKLMIATDLSASRVVDDLGKIGSIYFDTSEAFADNYDNLASLINELGQASPLTEEDIIASAMRVAPTAKQLGISLPDLFAVSTTVAERAASPERAGSQLSRALTENASNLDKFSKALGITKEEARNLIDTNAAGFFFDILEAIQGIDSASQRVELGNALFGGVGEKAVNALAANLPGLYDNIALANAAFDDGTSIQREYERSLDSVKSQLGILQNNFRYLGFTIAEVVLPYITKFAAIAIPALRSATAAFDGLSERTKLIVVGLGALVAILGPVTLFIGSLMFSVGIITTGFTAMFTQIIGIGVGLSKFALSIVALLAPLSLLRFALLGIGLSFLYIYNVASQAGNVFAGYVAQFVSWGYNLISGFASGIVRGAGVVQNAIITVINSFISLIQAFSPPKEGPLRGVRDWGQNLMGGYADGIEAGGPAVRQGIIKTLDDANKAVTNKTKTYLPSIKQSGASIPDAIADGVKENTPKAVGAIKRLSSQVKDAADEIIHIGLTFSDSFANALKGFDVSGVDLFSDAFGQVRSIIEAVGANLGLDRFDIDRRVLSAADAVTKLVSAIESGGSAFGSLSGIYDMMGGLGDETEALVNSQVEYNEATKELDRIKKSLDGIDDGLRKEIEAISARGDLTLNEKSALIRNARFRKANRKEQLEDEKDAAQERVDTLEDEMKRNETILRTLASLIFPAEKEKIKKEADDLTDTLSDTFQIGSSDTGLDEAKNNLKKLWDETAADADNFLAKIDKANDLWRGFIAGITGNIEGLNLDREGESFWKGFIPGQNIRLAIEDVNKEFAKLSGWLTTAKTNASRLFDILKGSTIAGYLGVDKDALGVFQSLEKIVSNIGYYFGVATREAETFVDLFKNPVQNIVDTFTLASKGKDESTTFLQRLDFENIGRNLGIAFNNVMEKYFNVDGEGFEKVTGSISAVVGGVVGAIGGALSIADLSGLGEGVGRIIAAILNGFSPENINPGVISGSIQEVMNSIIRMLSTATSTTGLEGNILSNILNSIIVGLSLVNVGELADSLKDLLTGIIGGLAETDWVALGHVLGNLVNNLLRALGAKELWTELGIALGGMVSGITTAIGEIEWGFAPGIFAGLGVAIGEALRTMFTDPESESEWKGAVSEAIGSFVGNVIEFIMSTVISALTGGFVNRAEFDKERIGGVRFLDDQEREIPTMFQGEFWKSLYTGVLQYVPSIGSSGEPEQEASTSPTSGGSSAKDLAFPMVLSPETIAQAEANGLLYNQALISGVETNLTASESVAKVSGALDSLMFTTGTESKEDIVKFGDKVGGYTVDGMVARFESEEAQTDFNSLLSSMGTWLTTNETNITGLGTTFGTTFVKGTTAYTEDSSKFMKPTLTGLRMWLRNASNKSEMNSAGQSFGTEILRGAGNALADSGSFLTKVLNKAITGVPYTAAEIDELLAPKKEEPVVSSSNLASKPNIAVASSSGTQVAGDTLKFEITINGGTPTDQKQAKLIADMIYDRMRKDGNLRGGSR